MEQNFFKDQLEKNRQQLYIEKERKANSTIIQQIQDNITNLEKQIEHYECRDFYSDAYNHEMPLPTAKK